MPPHKPTEGCCEKCIIPLDYKPAQCSDGDCPCHHPHLDWREEFIKEYKERYGFSMPESEANPEGALILPRYVSDKHRDFLGEWIISFIESVEKKAKQDTLAEVIERVEKLKRVVPKDPLDITPREAMANLGGNLVYRPYMSNEEAVNQTLQTLLASLRDK